MISVLWCAVQGQGIHDTSALATDVVGAAALDPCHRRFHCINIGNVGSCFGFTDYIYNMGGYNSGDCCAEMGVHLGDYKASRYGLKKLPSLANVSGLVRTSLNPMSLYSFNLAVSAFAVNAMMLGAWISSSPASHWRSSIPV